MLAAMKDDASILPSAKSQRPSDVPKDLHEARRGDLAAKPLA